MIVIASIWEAGWNTPIKELDLWHFPLLDFGVDELAMTPKSGIFTDKVREFNSVKELIDFYDLPIIICSEKGESKLKDFDHPKDALYLFNRTSGGDFNIKNAKTLSVETPNNQGLLWGHQAASIILYDRHLKNGDNNS